MQAIRTRFFPSLVLVTLLASSPPAAAEELVSERFFSLLEEVCLPALEAGTVPDLSGFAPYDKTNPDHNFLGPGIGEGFVADDPRLLIAFGEKNGYRGCEVNFAGAEASPEGKATADALETWIESFIGRSQYDLVDNCALPGFKYFVVAGAPGQNPRGYYLRILVHAMIDPDDEERYGLARALVGESPEPATVHCIEQ